MKKLVLSLIFLAILFLTACGGRADADDDVIGETINDFVNRITTEIIYTASHTRYQNLEKLAKVWGFTKYTHYAFISGQRCWDEELLALIPIVYAADPNDVNSILYDWFVGLGEDGFDFEFLTERDTTHVTAIRQMADLSWINEEYLGALAAHLLRFDGIRVQDTSAAPVVHGPSPAPDFSNQNINANPQLK